MRRKSPEINDVYVFCRSRWDEKDVILKNEPEKLLKTKERASKTNRNKPENEAEANRKTNRAMLLRINAH